MIDTRGNLPLVCGYDNLPPGSELPRMSRLFVWLACLTLLAPFAGCGCNDPGKPVAPRTGPGTSTGTDSGTDSGTKSGETTDTGKKAGTDPDAPFKFADLVEPFTPPTLEELEKTVEW